LEQREIDGALVSAGQSRELQAKGFAALLKEYPPDLSSYGGGLVVANGFLSNNRDVVSNVVHALSRSPGAVPWRTEQGEGHAGVQRSSQHHRRRKRCKQFRRAATQAVSFIGAVGKDADSDNDPRVLNVSVADLIDDQLVRKFDEDGEPMCDESL
jgi:hypothetical protein